MEEKKSGIRPKTVEEAVEILLRELPKNDIKLIKNLKEENIISLHHSLGRSIRNEFGLWQDNKELLQDTGKTHPDDASGVIIDCLWKVLQEREFSVNECSGLEF